MNHIMDLAHRGLFTDNDFQFNDDGHAQSERNT